MMSAAADGTTHPRKNTISFAPPTGEQSSPHTTPSPTSKLRRKAATTTTPGAKSRGFCRRISDCIVMGPAASHRVDQKQHVTEKLDQLVEQVEEIEKALQKQKEVKDMYKMRLEKTQVFLKYCLQVAQDNGFLELIVNKDKDEDLSLSPTTPTHSTTLTPQLSPSPPQFHPHLAPLIRQAKINGWYIDPQEVHFVTLPSS